MKPGAAVIATACTYESLAIATGFCPTITALCRARPRRLRIALLAGFSSWLWLHILAEQEPG